jgi:hypothetical protein
MKKNEINRAYIKQGNMRNSYKILVGKTYGYKPRGRHKRKLEHNAESNLRETEHDGRDWIQFT